MSRYSSSLTEGMESYLVENKQKKNVEQSDVKVMLEFERESFPLFLSITAPLSTFWHYQQASAPFAWICFPFDLEHPP